MRQINLEEGKIMKLLWTLTIAIFISILSLTLHIQPGALAAEKEGIIEINYPGHAEAKVEVNITGQLFSLAAKAVENEEDPSLSNFLAGLKALYVRVYETELLMGHPPKIIVKFYEEKLLHARWEVLARIRENGNMTGVYTLTQDDVITGLFVVVSDEQEDTVVVNLAGKIDLAKLSELDDIAGMDLKLPDLVGPEKREGYKWKHKSTGKKISPEIEAIIKGYREKALEYIADGRWDEAIAQLEQISEVDDYLISDYATLASIYLRKGDIGKCYYYLSRAYELEEDKETADILRSKSELVGEER